MIGIEALTIDPEFEAKCPPLTEEEFHILEENILSEGIVLMPLVVWNGIIIDGHNRYRIVQTHPEVSYSAHEKQFDNRYAAISWICKNQLGRRNLTPQQKKYLIGQRYEAEKMAHGGDRKSDAVKSNDNSCHLVSEKRTRKRLAEEAGISEGSVQNANQYAQGVDAAEAVLPGIKQELLSGAIRPKESDVSAIAKAPLEDRKEKAEALRIAKEHFTAKPKRQQMSEIRGVYADLLAEKAPVNEDDILESMQGTVTTAIRVCNSYFEDFPSLLSDSSYRGRVIAILQEMKKYIMNIEEDEHEI